MGFLSMSLWTDLAFSVFLNTVMDKTERIVRTGWRAVKINEGFYRKHKTEEVLVMTLTHVLSLLLFYPLLWQISYISELGCLFP